MAANEITVSKIKGTLKLNQTMIQIVVDKHNNHGI